MLGAVLLSGVALLALTGLLVALRRRWPGALTAWLVYGIVVLPLSGIVPFGRLRSAADRYTYVACIGLAVVAGGAVVLALRAWRQVRLGRVEIVLVAVGTQTALLGWSVLSWRETAVWRDSVTLWSRAVAVIPGSPTARNNLGAALLAQGEFERALEQFRVAEQTWTGHPGMLTNIGRALRGAGRLEEAATTFRRVVQIVPGWAGGASRARGDPRRPGPGRRGGSRVRSRPARRPRLARRLLPVGPTVRPAGAWGGGDGPVRTGGGAPAGARRTGRSARAGGRGSCVGRLSRGPLSSRRRFREAPVGRVRRRRFLIHYRRAARAAPFPRSGGSPCRSCRASAPSSAC
jgi:hypothetical protein